MNQHLKTIQDLIQQNNLSQQGKEALLKAIADADKQWSITDFKLDRTEKVKKTTAILLEETIAELEQKRKAVESQNRELEIESSLEKVRTVAMGMRKRDDMLDICRTMSKQLEFLGINEIRNVQTAIFYEDKGIYVNYEYYRLHDKTLVTDVDYTKDKLSSVFAEHMMKGADEVFTRALTGKEVQDWYNFQKTTNVFIDTFLEKAKTLNYYWFSLGPVALGISSYAPLSEEDLGLFKRFLNVFGLAYRRYLDIEQAEAQAREAQIQLALERVRARTMAMQKSDELADTANVLFQQLSELGESPGQISIGIVNEEEAVIDMWVSMMDNPKNPVYKSPISEPHVIQKNYQAWKKQVKSFVIDLQGKEMEEYMEFRRSYHGIESKEDNTYRRRVIHVAPFSKGMISLSSHEPRPAETLQLLERFAGVFDLTYTRFLDLQKAEAQAREATIEAALERVRYRAMAMQSSSDVGEATSTMFVELDTLGIETFRCGIAIVKDEELEVWSMGNTGDGRTVKGVGRVSIARHPLWVLFRDSWKKKDDFLFYYLAGKEKDDYVKVLTTTASYSLTQNSLNFPDLNFQSYHFEEGGIFSFSLAPHNEADKTVMKRFTNVFSLTFRRYQDLKQAEAQAREAQIEAALEKVRSRSMAMHHSDELHAVANVLFQQLRIFGANILNAGIALCKQDTDEDEYWLSSDTGLRPVISIPHTEDPIQKKLYEDWKNKSEFYSIAKDGKELRSHYEYMSSVPSLKPFFEEGPDWSFPTWQKWHAAYFSNGYLFMITLEPYEEERILIRFAKIFEQAYTRFLDLKKAEAQAREARIEAALERVRSRAMAMRTSEELNALIGTVFAELTKLDLVLTRCVIWIFDPATDGARWWMANMEDPSNPMNFFLKYHEHEPYIEFLNKWKEKSLKWVYDLKGQTKIDWDKFLFNETELANLPEIVKNGMAAPERILLSASFNNFGGVNVASLEPLSDEHFDILLRFAKVFDLTYTRFNDLKQAEAQAREAMIEAALERVRGKAMAMHNSKDLSIAASMVFTELRKIGINSIRCGVGLLSKENRKAQLYSATSSTDSGDSLSLIGWIELSNHPVSDEIYESWLKNEDYFPELRGEQLKSYYDNLLSGLSLPSVPNWQDGQKQYGSFLPFSVGCLYAWSEAPYNDTEIRILKRFAAIIDLTFRRYLELQTSEANARAAVKQAALDRIRADIASMRTISDLDRITPLIWNELTILGIPFIRCGVFIMDDSQKLIHTFLSTPDGKAIAAFHLPYDTPGNIGQVLTHWKENKNYIAHWDQSAFTELAKMLVKQAAIASTGQYLDTIPRDGFYLHFLPFLQGMLYVGNTKQLPEEGITLIQSVADAFSTAYARYEDFNRLEAAKQQVDKTLVELKQAQTQLVQSEKMASLGELTAGIAHEIQNPLNFVNNFSDVSSELLDEMRDELEKGNYKEAVEIANDVKQNLEKINHHGKRADGIVKGMLQHSRTSSGQKELTDINLLTDEYLRLAYHGLRAKDKSFNAKFETDFDDGIGKINIVPQDMGRVILNLINNAFYAISQRQKAESKAYEPTVLVSTKRINGKIEIGVKDNGNGIPQKVLDKIFQPFFTTKPTGQGTGLGLSLAYDIITKGHGGELKVKTKERQGSEFIIVLPIQPS